MPKALILLPDGLDKVNGFLNYAHAFTRLLKSLGFTVDIVAHHMARTGLPKCFEGLYNNIYWPRCNSPLVDELNDNIRHQALAYGGKPDSPWVNHVFPAAVLASIADYDLYVVHHISGEWAKHYLPLNAKKILFTHYYHAILNGAINHRTAEEIEADLRREIEPCSGFDLITTTGPIDREQFLRYRPESRVFEFPHCSEITPRRQLRAKGKKLLFTGYDNPSNRMALDWYVANVYPTLRKLDPSIELHILGKIDAYVEVKGYNNLPGIITHGYVADPKKLFDASDLILALIVHGEGIKTRIIEAMGLGIPVLTTSKGLINTRLKADLEVVVADKGPEMAKLIVKTLASKSTRTTLQKKGYAYAARYHSIKSKELNPLKDAILNLVGKELKSKNSKKPVEIMVSPTNNQAATSVKNGLVLLAPWTIHRCHKAKYKKIALWGAGAHTTALIPLWRELSGPKIVCILSSAPSNQTHISDVPIITIDQFDPSSVDAIVASSQTYEIEMGAAAKKRFPKKPFFTIWEPIES